MKQQIKRTSAIALFLATLSIALVGCGTGADNASMSANSTTVSGLIK